uniref:HECT domain-containing protein n=1 Tax=Parascaris univalens TaxID=6257 RepID=A0A915CBB7_PARUN
MKRLNKVKYFTYLVHICTKYVKYFFRVVSRLITALLPKKLVKMLLEAFFREEFILSNVDEIMLLIETPSAKSFPLRERGSEFQEEVHLERMDPDSKIESNFVTALFNIQFQHYNTNQQCTDILKFSRVSMRA